LKNDPGEITELSQKNERELENWRQRMVEHLSERGEEFVIDGKLVLRQETMLYSPNFPEDMRTENERLKDWREIYMGID
jgi:hypothetical protein